MTPDPDESVERDRSVSELRKTVDEAEFNRLWAEGRKLSLDQTVTVRLESSFSLFRRFAESPMDLAKKKRMGVHLLLNDISPTCVDQPWKRLTVRYSPETQKVLGVAGSVAAQK